MSNIWPKATIYKNNDFSNEYSQEPDSNRLRFNQITKKKQNCINQFYLSIYLSRFDNNENAFRIRKEQNQYTNEKHAIERQINERREYKWQGHISGKNINTHTHNNQ